MKLVQLNCKAAKSNMFLGDKKCQKDYHLGCLQRSLLTSYNASTLYFVIPGDHSSNYPSY